MRSWTRDASQSYRFLSGVNVRFLLLEGLDMPMRVEYGATDLGIVGKDVLLEQLKDMYGWICNVLSVAW